MRCVFKANYVALIRTQSAHESMLHTHTPHTPQLTPPIVKGDDIGWQAKHELDAVHHTEGHKNILSLPSYIPYGISGN